MPRLLRGLALLAGVLLGLALCVAATGLLYVLHGVSLLVVRQIPAHDAFRIAAHLRSVYLPGALAGLAAAATGRRTRAVENRAPLLLAALVAATGALSILDGILPARPHTLLAELS